MASALDPILAYKAGEVAALKARASVAELEARVAEQPAPRGFAAALTAVADTGENALICELKRKSPSAGEILPGADPVDIAREYETGGAACLSVLTDGPSFGGQISDLEAIRAAVALPLLRKDFMIDPLQVLEARAYGADAILIIMAALSDEQAHELAQVAAALHMDTLVEVHNADELDRALMFPSSLIGVNNRDLTKMSTDLGVTETLAPSIPAGTPFVSESGVKTPEDIIRLRTAKARRFLIGESLMKSENRPKMVESLRKAGTS